MKYIVRLLVFVTVFVLATHSSESYIRSPLNDSSGTPIFWNLENPATAIVSGGRIVYNLNQAGSDDLPFSEVERAIAASFKSWEDLPTCRVAFTGGPNTSSTATNSNGVFELFWLENSTTTSDGLNLAGALGVTRLTTLTGGGRTGEIIDAALVLNGNQFRWGTNGNADLADIQEVATHEIGHLIGLSHSPIGGSTMFPRTGPGRIQSRTLSSDDQIAASAAYPTDGFTSATGVMSGRVRDNNGSAIFGAHVTAVDGNGSPVAGAVSQPDGSYTIQGLPPGNYNLYAEPLDPVSGAYFSRFDLQGFYTNVNTDFQTSRDFPVTVNAGSTTGLDLSVTRGGPSLNVYFVSETTGTAFRNIPTQLSPGQNNVTVGVTGPGLPASGTPLSITGSGMTILRTYFRTTTNGFPAVLVDVNVSSSAPAGSRNIIINNGSQRTIVTGGIEVVGGAPPTPPVAVVSAANFVNQVAAESIVAAFGSNLATTTVAATSTPLPTSLGGTTVRLRDSSGNERLAPLFFVSPTQINYQVAPGILIGQSLITVTSGNGSSSTGSMQIDAVAPGLFTVDSTGKGIASAVVFRVKPNGTQTFEQIARFDQAQNRFVAIPIDLGPATDQVFLVLFGTGIRFRTNLPAVNIGGVNAQATFAGPQGTFIGLDQVNARLDRSLIGRGAVNVVMTVDGKTANTVSAAIK